MAGHAARRRGGGAGRGAGPAEVDSVRELLWPLLLGVATRPELTSRLGAAWRPTGDCRLGADDVSGPGSYRRVKATNRPGRDHGTARDGPAVAVRLGGPGVPLSSSGPGGAGLPWSGAPPRGGPSAV